MGDAAGADGRRRFACLYEAHRLHVLADRVRRTNRADALMPVRRRSSWPGDASTTSRQNPTRCRTCTASPTRCSATSFALCSAARSLDAKLRELGVADAGRRGSGPAGRVPAIDRSWRRSDGSKPVDREIVMLAAWEELPRSVIAETTGMTKAEVDQAITASDSGAAVLLPRCFAAALSDSPSETTGSAQV